jgi:hypothetical protein
MYDEELDILDEEINNESGEDDNNESTSKRGRQPGQKFTQRIAIILLNDTMRIRMIENEKSMFFERKSKHNTGENWLSDGYFSNFNTLLKKVLEICIKERIYTKQSYDYKEWKEIMQKIDEDIKMYADKINASIQNESYLKEIRET